MAKYLQRFAAWIITLAGQGDFIPALDAKGGEGS